MTIAVSGYATVVICLWLAVAFFTDRAGPATLVAFGPRWLAATPLLPLAFFVIVAVAGRPARRLIAFLVLTSLVLLS